MDSNKSTLGTVKGGKGRQKRWAPRARTGCITCKIRRIKCDETKPSCKKCVSTGRRCDGYAPVRQGQLQQAPSAWDFISTDSTELDSFWFFQSVTTSTLAEYFDPGFWSKQLLQFAHHYPALRHGITALACLHRDYIGQDVRFTPAATREIPSKSFALKQYTKSIHALSQLCSKPILTLEDRVVILTTCAIFASMCGIQSLQHQAYMHILNGLKIITSWEAEHRAVTVGGDEVTTSMLVLIFTRLDSQVIPYMFACQGSRVWIDRQVSPGFAEATFTTLFGAYVCIEAIYNSVLRLGWKFNKWSPRQRDISPEERAVQLQHLQAWDGRLAALLKAMPAGTDSSRAVDLLMVRRALTGLSYQVDLTPGELASDDCIADCLGLLDRITRLLGDEGDDHGFQRINASFTLEIGIVEPLFWMCVRCRNPEIRHRALRLLQRYPRQEGICDGIVAARTVAKVIEIEETGCPRAGGTPENKSPCAAAGKWVCENHRVAIWDYVVESASEVAVVFKTVEDLATNGPGIKLLYTWW
ncbi:Zn(II)2Cys6 transcription factor [Aspergillus saccharolyticus JOP 1030-1]|uniref:Zn(2)-C6 fungal-type domain-containing protein n=1 Tax=Aspergillus saccharolyticus JOP 1030-1 TaxID=1450539 RepID=A0A318Z806_9EURO|nr:hypothetical protein BP01DRAFT_303147 [Aspergillus saccharolyticus JOP 1030-1]PYH42547.1 hypothetical protein BP01DRAFT_303147 [Aspergillus saccharolyticus JOP 1030-1]